MEDPTHTWWNDWGKKRGREGHLLRTAGASSAASAAEGSAAGAAEAAIAADAAAAAAAAEADSAGIMEVLRRDAHDVSTATYIMEVL
jgi:hypothetical protein